MTQEREQCCPMCGVDLSAAATPTAASDPAAIRSQLEQLRQRLHELERGQTTPQAVQAQTLGMCPMCQGMMGGTTGQTGAGVLQRRLQQQIDRLEERVGTLERTAR
ncbi:MAG: hypothetical protein HY332_17040 [Chloroflexi bacterium]|nr:hypothetical protein [Chloroflexota bacterium]